TPARRAATAGTLLSAAPSFTSSRTEPIISPLDFLAIGLLSTAAGLTAPAVLAKGVLAATNDGVHNNRVLVVLQLGGGNDGLNTVVPHADPAYASVRPTIGIAADKVLRINDQVGLNPALPQIK